MSIGVQTFTIRKAQKKSIRSAYLPLIELGIKSFEVARIDFTKKNANELKSLIDEYGIMVSAIQVKPKYVFEDVDGIVEFCKITGCKRVVISMLPWECIFGKEEKFYSFISTLDRQYDIYAEHGITLAYHHHNWEYLFLSNGKSRMRELLDKTERIRIVHDTFWSAKCGIAPEEQIRELGSRLIGIHLRDLTFYKHWIEVLATDCPAGRGIIKFERVLAAAAESGCEYLVIEQNSKKPYEDIKTSYGHLTTIQTKE
jgi:sugar phosphate isomerase/epimerase